MEDGMHCPGDMFRAIITVSFSIFLVLLYIPISVIQTLRESMRALTNSLCINIIEAFGDFRVQMGEIDCQILIRNKVLIAKFIMEAINQNVRSIELETGRILFVSYILIPKCTEVTKLEPVGTTCSLIQKYQNLIQKLHYLNPFRTIFMYTTQWNTQSHEYSCPHFATHGQFPQFYRYLCCSEKHNNDKF